MANQQTLNKLSELEQTLSQLALEMSKMASMNPGNQMLPMGINVSSQTPLPGIQFNPQTAIQKPGANVLTPDFNQKSASFNIYKEAKKWEYLNALTQANI